VAEGATSDEEIAEPADGPTAEVGTPRLVWLLTLVRLPLATVRGLRAVGRAVYTALADPITNANEAVRERRAVRVRRVGQVAVSTALALVLIYAIFPVREYMDQRSATDRQNERLDVLSEANEQEAEYVEWLRSEEGQEWLARDYGYIYPDEESYTVVPNPDEEE
jgi:cell division protein FtsB